MRPWSSLSTESTECPGRIVSADIALWRRRFLAEAALKKEQRTHGSEKQEGIIRVALAMIFLCLMLFMLVGFGERCDSMRPPQ